MLNTLPTSVAPALRVRPPILRRRRGGQPSNRNALNHGLYAAKNQTPLTSISSSLKTYRQMPAISPAVAFKPIIQELQEEIYLTYQFFEKAENNRSTLAWFNTLVNMVRIVARLKTEWVLRYLPAPDLQFVSQHIHSPATTGSPAMLIRFGKSVKKVTLIHQSSWNLSMPPCQNLRILIFPPANGSYWSR
jgi:hypothetical protein